VSRTSGNSSQHTCSSHSDSHLINRWTLIVAGIAAGGLSLYASSQRTGNRKTEGRTEGSASTRSNRPSIGRSYKASASFAINCSPDKAYRFWHDFENLPRFMQYVDAVHVTDSKHVEWTAIGPMEAKLHWTAEITEDRENERIAWRSLPDSEIDTRGFVEFRTPANGRGTIVTATVQYHPPAGALGKTLAAIMGKDPRFTVREDLRRFKALLEAGEIPTTVGQSHGPRGLHGRASEFLLREKTNISSPQVHSSMRRVS
jgi:uncharacterized membrane protein